MATWTDPDTGTTYTDVVPIRITYTITAGAVSFALPPGIPGTIGAVVDVAPSGTCINFSMKVEVTANQGGTTSRSTPASSNLAVDVRSVSFTGAFYWVQGALVDALHTFRSSSSTVSPSCEKVSASRMTANDARAIGTSVSRRSIASHSGRPSAVEHRELCT
jgi:hypothetical protein